MIETLGVAVNRNGLHTLEVQETYEVDGPFAIELDNHGEASHIHLNLDDRLSKIARIEATNHYVEANERRQIRVETRSPAEWPRDKVRGNLKVATAHGSETRYVEIIFDRTPEKQPVEVDPELSRPHNNTSKSANTPVLQALPVGVLGGVALILAIGALFAADGVNFVLGAFSILAGGICAVAAYYLLG